MPARPLTSRALRALHKGIEPGTTDTGRWTDDETNAVVKAFDAKDGHGWLTSGAVSKAHKIRVNRCRAWWAGWRRTSCTPTSTPRTCRRTSSSRWFTS
ncbi:hypothetical protein ABZ352_32395 [Streptomyces griseofuscus]|uniref:hypothetical protein n=1 Tax=Streptomyces griseofuscus TaxID=146922 RepID=UPI0033E57A26